MKNWEDRNECNECSRFDSYECMCDKWNINRISGDKEPEKSESNPVFHNCFKKYVNGRTLDN